MKIYIITTLFVSLFLLSACTFNSSQIDDTGKIVIHTPSQITPVDKPVDSDIAMPSASKK